MKRNNQGFSYVELILVIAIMAIVIGIITLSMGLVSRSNVNRGADKLENTLNQARTASMAKGYRNGALTILCQDGKYYYYVGDYNATDDIEENKTEFANTTISVGYTKVGDEDSLISIGDGGRLIITYNQSTGAFNTSPTVGAYIDSIVLSKDDKRCVIKLYPETGKCTINPEVIEEESE